MNVSRENVIISVEYDVIKINLRNKGAKYATLDGWYSSL